MNNNNKGISTIVATVLIVLITVAAVTILWSAISPMLDISDTSACVGVTTKYQVDDNGEFSYVNETKQLIYLRVLNNGDTEASEVKVSLNVDGDTMVLNATTTDDVKDTGLMDSPTANGASVITFDATKTSITLGKDSKISASVVPVIQIEGEDVMCSGGSEVAIQNRMTA